MIDWDGLLSDLGVEHWTSGKNVAQNCVNIKCPMCDDHSNHGGFNTETGAYACWRCKGGHPSVVLARAAGIPTELASKMIRQYGGTESTSTKKTASASRITIPGTALAQNHKDYLTGRGFDPDELEFYRGIRGTGPFDFWNSIDFRLRVIIPVYDVDGSTVTFQGRDITGKQELRYKCCPVEMAVKHHKHTLYGAELCTKKNQIVVVEGVFDAWRLGPGAVCTFGTSVTREQINLMASWERVFVAFDPEPEAQQHAREIATELSSIGREVELVCVDNGTNLDGSKKDFGDMKKSDAEAFMRELGFKK